MLTSLLPHQAHFPFVQTLEGDGFRIANVVPLATSLGILCSLLPALNEPSSSGLALPAGKRQPVHRQCAPRGSHLRSAPTSGLPLGGAAHAALCPSLAPTLPCQSAVALAGACSPERLSAPFTQARGQGKPRLSSVFQQVPLFIFGQWVSLPLHPLSIYWRQAAQGCIS